ncbi:unnamed protein product [Linum tenue]|nr:unnamed protein product [Linum tenue]
MSTLHLRLAQSFACEIAAAAHPSSAILPASSLTLLRARDLLRLFQGAVEEEPQRVKTGRDDDVQNYKYFEQGQKNLKELGDHVNCSS